MTDQPTAPDYKSTVFLPQTDFPMKAGLAQKEPAIAARWAEMDLYGKLREKRAGRERFILHDGPPYANGDIHMGHAMNKVLKDIIVRRLCWARTRPTSPAGTATACRSNGRSRRNIARRS